MAEQMPRNAGELPVASSRYSSGRPLVRCSVGREQTCRALTREQIYCFPDVLGPSESTADPGITHELQWEHMLLPFPVTA